MSSPKPPAAPDPVATANAQGAMNRETAITQYNLNATNQNTPFGNLTYNQIGTWADGTPRYEANQSMSPELQGTYQNLIGSANRLSGNLQNSVGTQFDTSKLPAQSGAISAPGAIQTQTNAGWRGPGAMYDIAESGAPRMTIDNAGQITRNIANAGQITRNIANAGNIQRDVGPNDFSQDRQRVEEALFSRLNPQFEQDRSRQEADLVARGVRPGTAAYDRAMDTLNRSQTDARMQTVLAGGQEQSRLAGLELSQGNFRNAAQAQQYGQNANNAAFQNAAQAQQYGQNANDAAFRNAAQAQQYTQNANDASFYNNAQNQQFSQNTARLGAFNAGQQQNFNNQMAMEQFNREGALANAQLQNQNFNQQLAAGQFNNGNRQQALQESAFLRSLPMNEINALLSGTQIANPQFTNTPTPGVAGVDYAGLVGQNYQAQLQQYNQAQANRWGGLAGLGNGLLGAAGSAGGFGALFSDRRLKTDIKRVGQTDGGLPIYAYRYKDGGPMMFGVMADEVAQVMPEAVGESGGFQTVRYDMIAEAV